MGEFIDNVSGKANSGDAGDGDSDGDSAANYRGCSDAAHNALMDTPLLLSEVSDERNCISLFMFNTPRHHLIFRYHLGRSVQLSKQLANTKPNNLLHSIPEQNSVPLLVCMQQMVCVCVWRAQLLSGTSRLGAYFISAQRRAHTQAATTQRG